MDRDQESHRERDQEAVEASIALRRRAALWDRVIGAAVVLVFLVTAFYVWNQDQAQDRMTREACERGNLLRTYVRVDDVFARAFLDSLDPAGLTVPQRALVRAQVESRTALLGDDPEVGPFRNQDCDDL